MVTRWIDQYLDDALKKLEQAGDEIQDLSSSYLIEANGEREKTDAERRVLDEKDRLVAQAYSLLIQARRVKV